MKKVHIKKIVFTLAIIAILTYLIQLILNSPTVLFPMNENGEDYSWLLDDDDYKERKVRLSYGNLKNGLVVYDFDNDLRCLVWKFNEFKSLPNNQIGFSDKSIGISDFVSNTMNGERSLTLSYRMWNYDNGELFLKVNPDASIDNKIIGEDYYSLTANLTEMGICNNDGVCEAKLEFNEQSKTKITFLKKDYNYFVIVVYCHTKNSKELNLDIIKKTK